MLPEAVDVVVVGGGVAGLCTARLLAEGGATVVVAEAETLGVGASGRCGGQVTLGLIEAPFRVVAALGRDDAQVLYDLSRESADLLEDWGIFDRCGGWWVAVDDREAEGLARSVEALGVVGIPARVDHHARLDRPALWVPDEGTVAPGAAIVALAEAVAVAGGHVVEGSRVDAVVDSAGALQVQIGARRVGAEIVVYATGGRPPDGEGFFAESLIPVREQALRCAAAAVPGGRAGQGYTWWRHDDDAGLTVGGCRWATPHLEVGETEAAIVTPIQARIEAFAARLTAGVVEVSDRWAWIEGHTCDGLPLVGPLPGAPRRVACMGFCGNDWGLAPAAARSVAEGLLRESGADPTPRFAPSRLI